MGNNGQGLLRIGVFSTLSRISIRMLRHYQERGVLVPAEVDPFTGHRYYRPEQLVRADRVVALREAGFAVEMIAALLRDGVEPDEVDRVLEAQRAELHRRQDLVIRQLAALDHVDTILRGHPTMTTTTTDVTLRTQPAMVVAALRRTIATYSDEPDLWAEMMPLLEAAGAILPDGGICGATFHDEEFPEADVDVEVWEQVAEPFEARSPLTCRREPERRVAVATLRGSYDRMPEAERALGAFIAERSLATGPMFNIYLVGPAQESDPDAWVTEVCVPVID